MTPVEIKMKSMSPIVILQNYCYLDVNKASETFLKSLQENGEILYINKAMNINEANNYVLNKFEKSDPYSFVRKMSDSHSFVRKIEDPSILFSYEGKRIILNKWDALKYDGGETTQSFYLIVSPLMVIPVFKISFNTTDRENKEGELVLYNTFPRTAYSYSTIEPRFFRIKDHYASITTGSPVFNIINISLIEGITADTEKVEHTTHCTDGFSAWDEKTTEPIINYTLTLSSKKTIALDELNYLDLITCLVPFGENDVYGK